MLKNILSWLAVVIWMGVIYDNFLINHDFLDLN